MHIDHPKALDYFLLVILLSFCGVDNLVRTRWVKYYLLGITRISSNLDSETYVDISLSLFLFPSSCISSPLLFFSFIFGSHASTS